MAAIAPGSFKSRRPASRPLEARRATAVCGSVAVALSLGYGLHHLGPLRDHAVGSVAVAAVLAAVIAAAPALIALRRRELPRVIVARPGEGRVRPAGAADTDFASAVHREFLDHGFFTELGPRFLATYHRTFLESPHAVALVATVSKEPVGFLAGVLRPRAHSRWVISHRGIRLASLGAVGLLVRPGVAVRFVRTRARRYVSGWRRHRGKHGRAAPQAAVSHAAVLSHVAVLPGARGSGSGRRLVTAFVGACRADAIGRATLVSLQERGGAGGFYARLGWEPGRLHMTADGREMREWTLDLK